MPLHDALLAAEYEPRFRLLSDIPEVNETSHFLGVRLETPVGSRAVLRLGHRYTRAILETTVVDPGREYFFDLSLYTFNETTVAARTIWGRLRGGRRVTGPASRDAGGRLLRLRLAGGRAGLAAMWAAT
jgi:hypothetical protein